MAEIKTWNDQVFEEIAPEDRPQDDYGDGRNLRFRTLEHDEMTMPGAIEVMDQKGRWAIYVPLEINGKMVRPKPEINAPAQPAAPVARQSRA